MKLLLMTACAVLLGCGVIFGLVHHTVPHLVAPDLLPRSSARERPVDPLEGTIAGAGRAVQFGAAGPHSELVAGR